MVYSSDHGSMLGSHGHHHKQQPWEELVNVPLLLRFREGGLPQGGGERPPDRGGGLRPHPAGPAGGARAAGDAGRNLAPFLLAGEETNGANGARGQRPFSVYLSESVVADQGLREGIRPWRGVRTARFTYARDLAGPGCCTTTWTTLTSSAPGPGAGGGGAAGHPSGSCRGGWIAWTTPWSRPKTTWPGTA